MLANEQTQIIQKYIAAYNAFDVEGMLELLSPGMRFENWSGPNLTAEACGTEAFRQLAQRAQADNGDDHAWHPPSTSCAAKWLRAKARWRAHWQSSMAPS